MVREGWQGVVCIIWIFKEASLIKWHLSWSIKEKGRSSWFFFFNVELIGFVMDWMQVVKERNESGVTSRFGAWATRRIEILFTDMGMTQRIDLGRTRGLGTDISVWGFCCIFRGRWVVVQAWNSGRGLSWKCKFGSCHSMDRFEAVKLDTSPREWV